MTQFLYDEQDRILGHAVDGNAVLFNDSPAPQDDDLDDAVVAFADAMLSFPRLRGRVTRISPTMGRYNIMLLEAIREWMTKGNLRDRQQFNLALAQYMDYIERLLAHGVLDTKWEIDPWTLKSSLGWYFCVPDAKQPPTRRQIESATLQLQHDRETRARQDKADNKRITREIEDAQRMFAASPEGKMERRIEDTINLIVPPPPPTVVELRDGEELPPEVLTRRIAGKNYQEERDTTQHYVERVLQETKTERNPRTLARWWKEAEELWVKAMTAFEDMGLVIPNPLPKEDAVAVNFKEIVEGMPMQKYIAQLKPHPAEPPKGRRIRFVDDAAFFASLKNGELSDLFEQVQVGVEYRISRDSNDGGRLFVDVGV